ncbi:GtrA family protein [Candidatus Woesearchaeota archaeon]|nr:GtrA family protein [Candidatus Woesearchaeota archaeon]
MNIKKLFIQKTDNTAIQLIRYAFVGGTATIIDFCLLYSFTEYLKIHYLISAALAVTIALTYNYILCILWVFNKRTIKNKIAELTIFALIAATGVGANEIIIWGLTEYARFHYLISKIFSTIIVYLWNFFARKYIIFK